MTNTEVLMRALGTKRGHGSMGEAKFVAFLAGRFGASMIDAAGNLHFNRRTDPSHRSLFIAHTDTITSGKGEANAIKFEGDFVMGDGDTLGADDAAGIAILGHMMDAGIPGYYIFSRGEECGGIGANHLADEHRELLAEFDRAIAFDRAGYTDVITHQAGGRCASEAFAEALSTAFNDLGLLYMPCDGGVYTDTAEFTHIIPECTNISVGYTAQHGKQEKQDLTYLLNLMDVALKIEWDKLPTERKPEPVISRSTLSLLSGWDNRDPWSDPDDTEIDQLMDAWPRPVSRLDHEIEDAAWLASQGEPKALMDLLIKEHISRKLSGDEFDIAVANMRRTAFSPEAVANGFAFVDDYEGGLAEFLDVACPDIF